MRTLFLAAGFIFSALVLFSPGARGEDQQNTPVVTGDCAKISVHADNVPLSFVLAGVSETLGLNIFVAPSISEVAVTASFDNLSVEQAVRRLLKDFNYLASFKKENDKDRLVTLKIYPKGTSSGALVHIDASDKGEGAGNEATPPENMEENQENSAHNDNQMRLVSPETPEEAQELMNNPLMAIQQQFEAEKQQSLEEQIRLQRLIESTDDPEKKQGLQMSYAEEIARIKKMEDAFTSKIESLKRLQEFNGDQQ